MNTKEAKKITIINEKGVAVLYREDGAKGWSIVINGVNGGSRYYDDAQVDRMINGGGIKGQVTIE